MDRRPDGRRRAAGASFRRRPNRRRSARRPLGRPVGKRRDEGRRARTRARSCPGAWPMDARGARASSMRRAATSWRALADFIAFADGLERFLAARAEIETERPRGALYDALFPRAHPMSDLRVGARASRLRAGVRASSPRGRGAHRRRRYRGEPRFARRARSAAIGRRWCFRTERKSTFRPAA